MITSKYMIRLLAIYWCTNIELSHYKCDLKQAAATSILFGLQDQRPVDTGGQARG
jgi:hypothetical protein